MKLIVDTNMLISALIKDGAVRKILLSQDFKFCTTEQFLVEINKYIPMISKKAKMSLEETYLMFFFLLSYFEIIPISKYVNKFDEAYEIMKDIDEDDTLFIALALAIPNDGIWTEDKHFQKQEVIKIWTTKDLIEHLK